MSSDISHSQGISDSKSFRLIIHYTYMWNSVLNWMAICYLFWCFDESASL